MTPKSRYRIGGDKKWPIVQFLNLLLLTFFFAITGYGQLSSLDVPTIVVDSGQTVTMPAGIRYKASRWKEIWFGKHWRDEWTVPVSFPVIDLKKVDGGLMPIKLGGGHETKSLRVLSASGKEYVLRTIDKTFDALIPEQFKGSFLNDLMNDQVCTAHPYGPLAAAALSREIGILHTNPVFVFVPDDPLLGEFRPVFANKLCLFEERPSGQGWAHDPLTNYADQVINSEKLLNNIAEDSRNSVDQVSFLKARLLDMYINDWDRHEDQWVWAGKKTGKKTVYTAFARDRDQSFSKTDGITLYFLSRRWAFRNLQNMDPKVKDIIGANLSATELDRRFTNELSEESWKNTITSLQKALTDDAITQSLKAMPAQVNQISGKFLYRQLVSRRAHMLKDGMKYYRILSREITVQGSEKREYVNIQDMGRQAFSVTIQLIHDNRITKDTIYHRVFPGRSTRIINIYAHNGDDIIKDDRKFKHKTLIRVFGGEGRDMYLHSSHQKLNRVRAYDSKEDVPVAKNRIKYYISDTMITNYHARQFQYDWWMPLVLPGYNPDDGFVMGAGMIYRKMGWGKTPYKWQQKILARYASLTHSFDLSYHGIFKGTFKKWDLDIVADYKAPSYVMNFYGYGNNTKLETNKRSFYRVRANSLLLNPGVSRTWKSNYFKTDLLFTTVKVESREDKFVHYSNAGLDSSVFGKKYFGGAGIAYTLNKVDNVKYPMKGSLWHFSLRDVLALSEKEKNLVQLQASYTLYRTILKKLTIAHRVGGATNFGHFEFYQANSIGGSENLRGFWRTRYTGRSSIYQNTDIRWKITELKGYVFRGMIGIYGFFDSGRVWVKNDHSKKLHVGYGGGAYYLPYERFAINIYYGSSRESNTFIVRTGFFF